MDARRAHCVIAPSLPPTNPLGVGVGGLVGPCLKRWVWWMSPGLLVGDIFEANEFDKFPHSVTKSPGNWVTSTRRHRKVLGFELDRVGRPTDS